MIRCPNCNLEHEESVVTCDCGFNLQAYVEKRKAEQQSYEAVARPNQLLPTLLVLLQLVGVISILAGLMYAFALYMQEVSAWLVFAAFLGGILGSISYFALSEALTILLRMSEKQDKMMGALMRIEKG